MVGAHAKRVKAAGDGAKRTGAVAPIVSTSDIPELTEADLDTFWDQLDLNNPDNSSTVLAVIDETIVPLTLVSQILV